ncbi:RnfABCDGE type electron transport complex subunit G [Pontiella sulfatireligans]|uniref:Electron transport complex subunit RsxG n=1 Tax=Pontiella sulfatireligans TaxID=2750658 RepID=A0A6C2UUI3_9BACT|nr:RnfABCDGE type electron transport complex subunit G [Pontiella sulfatireligans]VGO23011.1 Electron transport complex subunit RsxG [Pontiella sulfatireligans]
MASQEINIPKLGIFLGALAAIAAGLLSFVSTSTAGAIKLNLQAKTNAALEQVLPAFDNVPGDDALEIASAEGWPVNFYIARKGGEIVGYAGEVITPEGFNGNVTVMAGLNLDGSVRTVIVTANTETPGLGTAITDRKVQKTIADIIKGGAEAIGLAPNTYLNWYAGKTAGAARWPIVKEGESINGKTGATITSRAVGGAVYAIGKTAVDNIAQLSKGAE